MPRNSVNWKGRVKQTRHELSPKSDFSRSSLCRRWLSPGEEGRWKQQHPEVLAAGGKAGPGSSGEVTELRDNAPHRGPLRQVRAEEGTGKRPHCCARRAVRAPPSLLPNSKRHEAFFLQANCQQPLCSDRPAQRVMCRGAQPGEVDRGLGNSGTAGSTAVLPPPRSHPGKLTSSLKESSDKVAPSIERLFKRTEGKWPKLPPAGSSALQSPSLAQSRQRHRIEAFVSH